MNALNGSFLADIDPIYAQVLHNTTKRSRFEVITLNAMETAKVAAAMSQHNVAVTLNACNCYTNYSILDACLKAGSHYIDMAADIYSAPGVKKPGKNSFEHEIETYHSRYLEKGHCRPPVPRLRSRRGEHLCPLGHGPTRHGH